MRQHGDTQAIGHHHLAHLGAVGAMPVGGQLGTEEPLCEAMHEVARAYGDEPVVAEVVHRHLPLLHQRVVLSDSRGGRDEEVPQRGFPRTRSMPVSSGDTSSLLSG